MKRLFLLLLAIIALACSNQSTEEYILVSNYPLKLIIQPIVGEKYKVECLVPPNVSPHVFQPRASDIVKLEQAKFFFYVSTSLEPWVKSINFDKVELISLLPSEKLLDFENFESIDPHFWTDPIVVAELVDTLAKFLGDKFNRNRDEILSNAKSFKERLKLLDQEIAKTVEPLKNKKVITFHPSFRYFLNRYGLEYIGSIEEIAGSEPQPEHFAQLMEKIRTLKVEVIFTEPQLNPHSAEVMNLELKLRVYEIDPLGAKGNSRTYEELIKYYAKSFVEAFESNGGKTN